MGLARSQKGIQLNRTIVCLPYNFVVNKRLTRNTVLSFNHTPKKSYFWSAHGNGKDDGVVQAITGKMHSIFVREHLYLSMNTSLLSESDETNGYSESSLRPRGLIYFKDLSSGEWGQQLTKCQRGKKRPVS